MIKSTQQQLINTIQDAIEYENIITVKFDVKFTIEEAVAALRESIHSAPIKDVEAKFTTMLSTLREREFTGTVTSLNEAGLCKIVLPNGAFKSFYMSNVRSITADGFTYVK
jgi:hypothetical protein